jgi:hypothetical protein
VRLAQRCRSRSSRCIVDQKDSIIVLSTLLATRPMEPSRPAARSRCPKIHDVYWLPRSEWTTVPAAGRRRQRAISSASTTSSARMWSAIDQPTIARVNTSRTAAT